MRVRATLASFVLLFILGLAFVVPMVVTLFKTDKSIDTILRNVTNQTKQQFDNVDVSDSPWPAQMGSEVKLRDAVQTFSIGSQSFPTINFTLSEPLPTVKQDPTRLANTPQDAHRVIADVMQSKGLTADRTGDELPVINYVSDAIQCVELYDRAQSVLTLSCYYQQLIASRSEEYKPFVSAYNEANTDKPITTEDSIGPVVIKSKNGTGVIGSSRTADYDITEAVVIAGNQKQLALFYNKGNGPWKFITSAQDEYGFTCGSFTTNPEVRAAMYDQICLSNTGHVKLDTNNRALQ